MNDFQDIYEYIDSHFDEHVKTIQKHLRQSSVSLTNEGVHDYAEMLANSIRDLGGVYNGPQKSDSMLRYR